MNETLCRALAAARLHEEDVAAGLGVDPKTVRRWLEGRVPHRRHRWALAAMLGLDDAALWPGPHRHGGRPDEVVAIYPRRAGVPAGEWVRLLSSARREIGLSAQAATSLAQEPGVRPVLLESVLTGTRVRVYLESPERRHGPVPDAADVEDGGGGALAFFGSLVSDGVEVRMHRGEPYEGLLVADQEMLVFHRVWGIADALCPVMHLRRCHDAGLFAFYLESFERVWAVARPVG